MKPVTSGYRFVLTYNLIYTAPGAPQTAASINNGEIRLRNTLTLWKDRMHDSTAPKSLAYILGHQYTEASLSFDQLKGRDRSIVRSLMDACEKEGFCIYLANVHREVEGGCGGYGDDEWDDYGEFHKIEDVCSDETFLRKVIDRQGSVVAERLKIDDTQFVQHGVFKREPDDEDYSGYTGNEGVSATHFYNNTVSSRRSRWNMR